MQEKQAIKLESLLEGLGPCGLAEGVGYCFCLVFQVEFLQQSIYISADRALGDEKPGRDFRVGQTLRN